MSQFGFDFMLDVNLRPWLLEVNSNPYLNKQNDFHEVLLKKAMEDLFRLTVDPMFKGSGEEMTKSRKDADAYLGGLIPEQDLTSLKNASNNGFDLLCNLKEARVQPSRSQGEWERFLSPRGEFFHRHFQDMNGALRAFKRVRSKSVVAKDVHASGESKGSEREPERENISRRTDKGGRKRSSRRVREPQQEGPSRCAHSPNRSSMRKVREGRVSPKLKQLKKKSAKRRGRGQNHDSSSPTSPVPRTSSTLSSLSPSRRPPSTQRRLGIASPPPLSAEAPKPKTLPKLRPIARRSQPSETVLSSITDAGTRDRRREQEEEAKLGLLHHQHQHQYQHCHHKQQQHEQHKTFLAAAQAARKKFAANDGVHESLEIRKRGIERCALLQQRIRKASRKSVSDGER